ncbi:MAG: hypothetical protein COC01_00980 [Bacteroidetes bacterium]|nr:MAG: hypothetical protein COC01_00980 [Bacteroidota bacterium]
MWLFGRNIDLTTLFFPVWAVWILLFCIPSQTLDAEIPLWVWVVGVLMIDVAHVWSTIFRTYFDKAEFANHKRLLGLAPILCFVILFTVASESIDWFWRGMAYLALFHFIKQQYGFFALYSVRSGAMKVKRYISDKFAIYLSMLYPVLFWHLNFRDFNWFVDGDFIQFQMDSLLLWQILNTFYWLILAGWLTDEIRLIKHGSIRLSLGRILWLFTTAINWYLGIIYFNSDLAFTLTNVVAHGVPYIVLIIFYQSTKQADSSQKKISPTLAIGSLVIIGSLFFAFGEEYLWDLLLSQDKQELFGSWITYPEITNTRFQAIALALLSLPQVVHYVLDGFIWKMNDSNPHLRIMMKLNE